MNRQRGFTILEVVLAVSLGVLLIVGASAAFSAYRIQTNYNRAKMLLAGTRSNITMYRYRKGSFPKAGPVVGTCTDGNGNDIACSICTNTDDQGNPFFPGSNPGTLPIDPVRNIAAINDTLIANCAATPAWDSTGATSTTFPDDTGGWLYDPTLGVLSINLKNNDATYGVAEEQPQPTTAPGSTTIVGGW